MWERWGETHHECHSFVVVSLFGCTPMQMPVGMKQCVSIRVLLGT